MFDLSWKCVTEHRTKSNSVGIGSAWRWVLHPKDRNCRQRICAQGTPQKNHWCIIMFAIQIIILGHFLASFLPFSDPRFLKVVLVFITQLRSAPAVSDQAYEGVGWQHHESRTTWKPSGSAILGRVKSTKRAVELEPLKWWLMMANNDIWLVVQ